MKELLQGREAAGQLYVQWKLTADHKIYICECKEEMVEKRFLEKVVITQKKKKVNRAINK